MLVLHSSSRCDVCLSEYSWETAGKRPHAIACGHIFCRDCLYTNTPPLCPLCRHVYQPNKMKRLHVDRPEDIDDHKETDLLQRLVISWDTPPEQLAEVVGEVDAWLAHRSEESCVALRKARGALERTQQLKEDEADLERDVGKMQDELQRLQASIAQERTNTVMVASQYLGQIESMTREIRNQKSQIDRLQANTNTYKHSYIKNPLPSPPQPVSTPNLPSFEQALSESASGVRMMELPSSPAAPYQFEVESRKSRKRRTQSSELRHTYDDTRYRASSQVASSSHYVHPHISAHRESSPLSHASRLAYHFENTAPAPAVDPYMLVEDAVREYSSGFVSGAEAALGMGSRRREPVSYFQPFAEPRATHSSGLQAVQSASAFEPADGYRPASVNVYQSQPYSAPVRRESPLHYTHHRQSVAAESSIVSSASSHARDSPPSRSRSRSHGAHRSATSAHERTYHSNPLLASILSDDGPEAASSRRSNGTSSSSPHVSRAHAATPYAEPPPPPPHREASSVPPAPPSPSAQSLMTLDSGSWGTPAPSHLTTGSLIPGLASFRIGVQAVFEGGEEFGGFRALNSDGESIRTRQASISDLASEEATSHVSRSPARPVHSMVGVLPDDRSARSSARSSRDDLHGLASYRSPPTSGAWDANGHSNRSSRAYSFEQDAGRAPSRHEHRGAASGGLADRYAPPPREQVRRSQTSDAAPSWAGAWAGADSAGVSSGAQVGADEHAGQGPPRRAARALRDTRVLSPGDSPDVLAAAYLTGYRPVGVVGHADASGTAAFAGNALGLELSTGSTAINAPTPMVPQTFLRSWSQDH